MSALFYVASITFLIYTDILLSGSIMPLFEILLDFDSLKP